MMTSILYVPWGTKITFFCMWIIRVHDLGSGMESCEVFTKYYMHSPRVMIASYHFGNEMNGGLGRLSTQTVERASIMITNHIKLFTRSW